jgi:hypothetical protein
MLRKPLGEGTLYAAQTGCVGFHPFPGEGAASCEIAMKINRENTRRNAKKKQKNLCNLRNLWFLLFHRLRAWPWHHEELI